MTHQTLFVGLAIVYVFGAIRLVAGLLRTASAAEAVLRTRHGTPHSSVIRPLHWSYKRAPSVALPSRVAFRFRHRAHAPWPAFVAHAHRPLQVCDLSNR
jgi:hypothetical protein